ncbi:hypothetical protein Ccrd_001566 [Cynara cardunculus var. scolymus]|uniref:RING-type domain-containing protein n=1 Tax=Cynara cardunculus var. scolymus TaxID=59895 RepID=A0A103XT11_CYNCS|nr:hypothetical protein Ccrd_001566 [Cynara cardunculus var. scolymus]
MGVMMVVAWMLQMVFGGGNDNNVTGGGDDGGVETFDCVVCLCEVSPADHHQKLPNCNHGLQFHEGCIDSWLKNHSTCPICRVHVPQTVHRQLYSCFSITREIDGNLNVSSEMLVQSSIATTIVVIDPITIGS